MIKIFSYFDLNYILIRDAIQVIILLCQRFRRKRHALKIMFRVFRVLPVFLYTCSSLPFFAFVHYCASFKIKLSRKNTIRIEYARFYSCSVFFYTIRSFISKEKKNQKSTDKIQYTKPDLATRHARVGRSNNNGTNVCATSSITRI